MIITVEDHIFNTDHIVRAYTEDGAVLSWKGHNWPSGVLHIITVDGAKSTFEFDTRGMAKNKLSEIYFEASHYETSNK